MKTSTVSFTICMITLVCLSLSILSLSQGEIGPLNRGKGSFKALSQEAGSNFFKGLSMVYLSLEALEKGNVDGANNLLTASVESNFKPALSDYYRIQKGDSRRPVILGDMPLNQIGRIASDLQNYEVTFPNTEGEISDIALTEVNKFAGFLSKTRFIAGDTIGNQQRVRDLYKKIFRVTILGLSTSELTSMVSKYGSR